jgi:hypothetical protein
MKNVTITLDEEVARWARIRAAELETSVSRLVGQMLKEKWSPSNQSLSTFSPDIHRSQTITPTQSGIHYSLK